jgi:hypothetical protein
MKIRFNFISGNHKVIFTDNEEIPITTVMKDVKTIGGDVIDLIIRPENIESIEISKEERIENNE